MWWALGIAFLALQLPLGAYIGRRLKEAQVRHRVGVAEEEWIKRRLKCLR